MHVAESDAVVERAEAVLVEHVGAEAGQVNQLIWTDCNCLSCESTIKRDFQPMSSRSSLRWTRKCHPVCPLRLVAATWALASVKSVVIAAL